MKTSVLVLASLFVAAGCTAKSSSSSTELGVADQLLVADDQEASDTDDDAESGIDESLSGADPLDPQTPAEGSDAERLDKIRKNPGRFFQPAGCITTTIAGNVATHVFVNCTGPHGMKTFNGTVTSTWTFGAGTASVTHAATDFHINGNTISGSRIVSYSKAGSVYTKVRTGAWSGETAKGKAITHTANFTVTYDAATKCVTRNGTATSSVGARDFSRTVTNYERCGVFYRGCPKAGGKITLKRNDRTLVIDFEGGQDVQITLPGGNQVDRQLVCLDK